MNVIVAGEESGVTRDAFAALGHNAWSCDLKPSRRPGQHYQGSWHDIHWASFDLLIGHPECTHLAVSGAHRFAEKVADGRQQAAIEEFMFLANAPVRMKCIEQPVSIMSTLYRKPDQIIQPYHFGHDASKKTCYWLTGLPLLRGTLFVPGRIVGEDKRGKTIVRWANQTDSGQNRLGPSEKRAEMRSETFQGIADAMAAQWGGQVERLAVAA
jgi:hypothetical protein